MINVICTHLNYKYEHQQVREDQVNQIIEYISKLEPSKFPIILCGDFNADPESDEIRKITGLTKPVNDIVLRDVWKLTNRNDPGYTWSNSNDWAKKTLEYNRRIDYIFLGKPGPNGLGHPIECNLVGTEKNKFFPSDHFGLLAHLVGMN
jgi:endonuclease/exonuclease/phosphatase family metal-dependent hydrolase